MKTSCDFPTGATTAVSLRRLQHFKTEPGKSYRRTLSRDGTTPQSVNASPDEAGLLTIESLNLLDQSAQLRIAR